VRRIRAPRLLLGILVGLALARPAGPVRAERGSAIVVSDARGRKLSFAAPVRRVVCLIESALSGFFMLGAGDRVVGVSEQVFGSSFDWYARLDDRIRDHRLSVPGNWDFASLESITALRPDLVIMWAAQRESITALEERGIPVFGVFVASEDDLFREIAAFGALTGTEERAKVLLDWARAESARLSARVSARPAIDVFYMWPGGELETSCGPSMVDVVLRLAGGRNVCASLGREHVAVNPERLLFWDPAALVLWPSSQRRPQDVLADRRWQTLRAVRNGVVFELPEPFLADQWTLKYLHGAKVVAKRLHPEALGDLDLDADARTMLRFLYGPRIERQP
jgi:iron complex transport system substrate-binding protein